MTLPTPLPPNVAAAFVKLGEEQRGTPEILMVEAQHLMGGGVFCFLIEHVGDLTHRMTNLAKWGGSGWDMVHEKVRKLLPPFRNPYGFEREMNENFEANARHRGETLAVFLANLAPVIRAYTQAHRALTVYNRCQWLAREAAVAAGDMDFARCERLLTVLEEMLATPTTFEAEAFAFTLGADGEPLPYSE